jgi:hypothetical protein
MTGNSKIGLIGALALKWNVVYQTPKAIAPRLASAATAATEIRLDAVISVHPRAAVASM